MCKGGKISYAAMTMGNATMKEPANIGRILVACVAIGKACFEMRTRYVAGARV